MENKSFFSIGELIGYFLFIMIGLNIIVAIPLILKIYPDLSANFQSLDGDFNFIITYVDEIIIANIGWQLLSVFTLLLIFRGKKIALVEYFNLKDNLKLSSWLLVVMLFFTLAFLLSPASDYFEVPPNPTMKYLIENGNIILIIITAIVAAPILEELIFRGWLFRELENLYSQKIAFHVTSILFTIIHIQYNIGELLLVLVIAYSLAFIRLKTKNIVFPISLHLLNNSAALIEFLSI